jgi:2-methylcitrate dehydratase PrpD
MEKIPDGDSLAAQFIRDTRWKNLPEEVRDKARMCLMDNLAAVISGSQTGVSRIAADFASACMPGDGATILMHGKRAAIPGAAFANGCAANGLDTDDGARYAYGHAGAQIFPTVLAVAEAGAAGGSELLTGMVVGYETAHRIGRCWQDHHKVYQACGSWGSVACAAAAAHLMGLKEEQIKNALGIAEYHSPNLPMMRDIAHPGMVKHGIGWGALTGITAAQLAARGFTGIPTLLSFDTYRDWARDIGKTYIMVDGVGWKAKGYACCGWAHAAAEGSLNLADRHNIDPNRIERIVVETFAESAALGTELPSTTEEAQFNLAWPVASMLVYREIGPAQMLEEGLHDERIRNLARRVEVRESEELNELARLFQQGDPRGRFASSVTLVLKDGTEFDSGLVEGGFAYPPAGWNEERMEEKFRWLTEPVLGKKGTEKLLATVRSFEKLPDLRELIEITAA